MLEELERHNLLVVPLDRHGEWYRYHHLLRQLLQTNLRRNDPNWSASCIRVQPTGTKRTGWPKQPSSMPMPPVTPRGWPGCARADVRGVAERPRRHGPRLAGPPGRSTACAGVRRRRCPRRAHLRVAGRAREAERWVGVAESLPGAGALPDGSTVAATLAYLRANLSRDGTAAMRAERPSRLRAQSGRPFRATMLTATRCPVCSTATSSGPTPGSTRRTTPRCFGTRRWPPDPRRAVPDRRRAGQWPASTDVRSAVESWKRSPGWVLDSALILRGGRAAPPPRRDAPVAPVRPPCRATTVADPRPPSGVAPDLSNSPGHISRSSTRPALIAVPEQAQGIVRRRPDLGTLPVGRATPATVDQITVAAAVGISSLTTAEFRLVRCSPPICRSRRSLSSSMSLPTP